MIRSFHHKGLERLYRFGDKRGVIANHIKKLSRILAALDVAKAPRELDIPGFRLHQLKGVFSGHWSITVQANWRVVFQFEGIDVKRVDYLDYH